ncbi:MAG: serine hydrolase, partial [Pyrinomonadaceae bacterium]
MKKNLVFVLIAFVANIFNTAAQSAKVDPKSNFGDTFDAYIRQTMGKVPDIPGVAIVIIKDDKPIFVRAYGMADMESGRKADTDTVFYIASSTKSFTALAAALLDREGKIKLSDPITKYAAGLELKTSLPDKVTIRDLLTHTSGLRNEPLTFRLAYSGESEAQEMARVFAGATKYDDAAFGKYRYDNLGYNIYGVLLRNYLKKDWQDLLDEKVFRPLGMKHTTAYFSRTLAKKWVAAEPYMIDGATGNIIRSPLKKTDNNMQSAGGIFTSISDIGRWLEMNMNDGRLDGKQVLPADVVRAVHTGYTQTTRDAPPFSGNGQYGLGWQIGKYKNDKVIYHHGGFAGYRSHISFMPDKKIGIAVLVNNDFAGSRAADLFATYAYDSLNGIENLDADYAKQLTDFVDSNAKAKQQMQASAAQRASRTSQLASALSEYVGRYKSEYLGTIDISEKDGNLLVKMGNIKVVPTP